ncbi:hypothetical protein CYY_009428 [Polysphondylium violaceum]|uniref:COX assembly mitochondrial protein n=1 Tax=Polysphondylium violaceum TaxID=133409 RepID=A0A8J4PLQ8_9MYCE|nr:hypothetical protein CYY_009428 [Polysphondylium violaceum]
MSEKNLNTDSFEDKRYLEIPDSEIVLPAAIDSYLRQKLKDESLKNCGPQVAAFAECSKDKLFSVIWECRELQELMKNCLIDYTTSDKLKEMKRDWIDSAKKRIYEQRLKKQEEINNKNN